MDSMKRCLCVLALLGLVTGMRAQGPAGGEERSERIRELERRLEQLQEAFERTPAEQKQQMEALQRELELVRREGVRTSDAGAVASGAVAAPVASGPEAAGGAGSLRAPGPFSWRLGGGGGGLGGGGTYVDVGLVGTFAVGTSTAKDIEGGLQPGGHDPNQRGFTVQGVELNLTGAVDPYFMGSANLLYSLDASGESHVELEEAWMETLQLPAGLQVRAGQFYAPFGRINGRHPHQWGFVDAPLVTARLLGPDGLRNPGVQVSWLLPMAIYSQLFVAVQDSQGDGAAPFRGGGHVHGEAGSGELPLGFRPLENDRGVSALNDLLWTLRYAVSWDLTPQQTVLMGVSAALGPNASGAAGQPATQIYGLDLYWKWKSPRAHAGFPFVSLQAEALMRRYELGAFDWAEHAEHGEPFLAEAGSGAPAFLPAETVNDYGFYTELLYGFRRGWVVGLRFDYVTGDRGDYEKGGWVFQGEAVGRDLLRRERWRVSPNLTWYPTEYSKLRLQYNYDRRRDVGEDHSLWLQVEMSLGAHAAHQF
jgi:hypothetical protein